MQVAIRSDKSGANHFSVVLDEIVLLNNVLLTLCFINLIIINCKKSYNKIALGNPANITYKGILMASTIVISGKSYFLAR